MEGQRESVKLSVASCLTRVLGSDQHARKQAEEELKALEVTEGDYLSSSRYKRERVHELTLLWQSLEWCWLT